MVEIVSMFAWSLIVIDGTKVFCRILGMMHMTRKIASEEQDKSMADIEPSTENQDLPGSHTIIGECSTLP